MSQCIINTKIWCVDDKLKNLGIDDDHINCFLDCAIDIIEIATIKRADEEEYEQGCKTWIYLKNGSELGISAEYDIILKAWKFANISEEMFTTFYNDKVLI